MPFTNGDKLGSYEILSVLGAGGMGEVYRARDSKLGREVAIKVLPDELGDDRDKLARFEREARLLAALNHPRIATLYGVEEFDAKPFLVMELVEGETLAERITRGPIPVSEVLALAHQIAEALEAAHEKGVIHRDLKPANIKVHAEGNVKVLDFGLAKAFGADESSESELSQSPTLSRDATRAGVILGTAAYMSPEQAKGKAVDKRTDVFSFGIVLYEMLTGKKAFEGDDVPEVLASIINREPAWSALPSDLDPRLEQMVRRCLRKDRKSRLQSIGDARVELEDLRSDPIGATSPSRPLSGPNRARMILLWALSLLLALLAGGVLLRAFTPEPRRPIARFVIETSATESLASAPGRDLAISPDGSLIAYRSDGGDGRVHLYLRPIDRLVGTRLFTAATVLGNPVFSPDGRSVLFETFDDLTWKRASVLGGTPDTLFSAQSAPGGASWGEDGTVVFAMEVPNTGLLKGSVAGGEPQVLTTPETKEGEHAHRWPDILPGGQAVLFNIVKDSMEVAVLDLRTGEKKVLLPNGSHPRYAPTGHIVYGDAGALMAVPFDLERLELTGEPVRVIDDVLNEGGLQSFDFSTDGSLVYVAGASRPAPARSLVWVYRDGHKEILSAEPRAYTSLRISPDGRRIALSAQDQEQDIWIWDIARETLSRLTFAPSRESHPVWTRDGERVAFESNRDGRSSLYWKGSNGTGAAERMADSETYQWPDSFTPDGTRLVYGESRGDARRRLDLGVLSLTGDGSSAPLVTSAFTESRADISPDGHWLAYESDATGQYEIYVRPFPNVEEGLQQVSRSGGTEPRWSGDGSELFYLDRAQRLVSVSVRKGSGLEFGTSKVVNEVPYAVPALGLSALGRSYDVSPDGERFLMLEEEAGDETPAPEIILVQNWFEELKRLVPTP